MDVARLQLKHYLLILVALAVFAVNTVLLYVLEDDAYISFRYLDNWLTGNGLVFNAGERVEGYTNLLWILLMAPWRALGMSPELVSLGLSLLAAAALFGGVYFLASRLVRHASAGIAAVILTAAFPPLAHYVTSGLETILYAALVTLAFARLAAAGRPDAIVAALLGAAVMTRPEAMMIGVVVYGIYGLPGRTFLTDRQVRLSALLFLSVPATLTVWRLWYYGDPLPNTFYAKATGMGMEFINHGLGYLSSFAAGLHGWLLLAPAALVFLPRVWRGLQDRPLAAALGLVLLLHLLYVVKVGGDYLPMSRFILHVFPLLVALGLLGMWHISRERAGVLIVLALAIAAVQNLAFYRGADYAMMTNLKGSDANLRRVADWLKSAYPPGTVIAVDNAGIIPYVTGFKSIDMLGLNDRHIARAQPASRINSNTALIPGHFKYDGEYVCSLQPDVVVMLKGMSIIASSQREAIIMAALNSLDSDRAFLNACGDRYEPNVSLLENGRYQVVYTQRHDATAGAPEMGAFERGLMLMGQARLAEARESFMESIRNNQHLPDSYTNIGYTWFDEGRLQDAVAAFEETLRRYPGHPPAIYGLALSTENLGDKKRAAQLWRQYLNTDADPKWKARVASRLDKLGYAVSR